MKGAKPVPAHLAPIGMNEENQIGATILHNKKTFQFRD